VTKLAVLGLALGLAIGVGCSANVAANRPQTSTKRPPSPMTSKIVACERSGKLICDPAAYRRDRAHGGLPLSYPDPKGAHILTLRQVLPSSWRHEDYAAELMTYGQARRIAPGLAGATRIVVDPSRKFWVLTRYYRPPIKVLNTWGGPPGVRTPSKVTVRAESQTVDAVTGSGVDSCTNCAAIREPLRYPAFGVTLMPPLPGYRPSISRSEILALFRRSGIAGSDLPGHPTVKLRTVRDVRLPRGGYPAWVITFHHTSPTSYGPGRFSPKPVCDWVAIYNLQAGAWKEDFQSCPEPKHPLRRYTVTTVVAAMKAGARPVACESSLLMTNKPGGGCGGVPVTGHDFLRFRAPLQFPGGGWQTSILHLVGTWDGRRFHVTSATPAAVGSSTPQAKCAAHHGPIGYFAFAHPRRYLARIRRALLRAHVLSSNPCGLRRWFLVPVADHRTVSILKMQFGRSIIVTGWLHPVDQLEPVRP
jgi:hypothetical protein